MLLQCKELHVSIDQSLLLFLFTSKRTGPNVRVLFLVIGLLILLYNFGTFYALM